MAIRGLRYEETAKAIESLVTSGRPLPEISLREIREETGTGSFTTIQEHYRLYCQAQTASAQSTIGISPELVSEMLRPLEGMLATEVAKATAAKDAMIADLEGKLVAAKCDQAQSDEVITEQTVEIDRLHERVRQLEEKVAENLILNAQLQGSVQSLEKLASNTLAAKEKSSRPDGESKGAEQPEPVENELPLLTDEPPAISPKS